MFCQFVTYNSYMSQISLILHDIRSTYNVGSILRSAECFGVQHVYFSGYTPYPLTPHDPRLPHIANKLHQQIAKTALGAESLVPFSIHQTITNAVAAARQAGYTIAALEQDAHSTAIETYRATTPVALILGNEVGGVDEWTKDTCDVILEIKQYGTKESLNVASAAAIALYALKANTQ